TLRVPARSLNPILCSASSRTESFMRNTPCCKSTLMRHLVLSYSILTLGYLAFLDFCLDSLRRKTHMATEALRTLFCVRNNHNFFDLPKSHIDTIWEASQEFLVSL